MKVDLYILGQRYGQCEVDADSLCGRLAQGDLTGAGKRLAEMIDEINAIPNVEASATIQPQQAEKMK